MGRKNKTYRLSLHQQVYNRLTDMQAFGEIRDVNMVYRLADNRMYENKKTCHDARK